MVDTPFAPHYAKISGIRGNNYLILASIYSKVVLILADALKNHGFSNEYVKSKDFLEENIIDVKYGLSYHALGNFPIVSLFRHFLELKIKGLIYLLAPKIELKVRDGNHNLEDLWEILKKKIASGNYASRISEDTEKFVLGIAEIDPNSQAYRYPEKRDGSAFFSEENSKNHVYMKMNDITELEKCVKEAIDNFENLEGDIDYRLENEAEYRESVE